GPICPSGIRRTRPATAGSNGGCRAARWSVYWNPLPAASRSAAGSISANASPAAPAWWRKRGRLRGSDQAGQRYEAHGSGRPCWSSSRRMCCLGFARAEVTLVAATLDSRFVADLPERLIGDRAYDADPL